QRPSVDAKVIISTAKLKRRCSKGTIPEIGITLGWLCCCIRSVGMDRWQAMRVFVKVAETGAFAAAARQLRMSPPAVTRTVPGLEEAIGARLLTRTTRQVKLTEAGSRYLEDCRRILADIAEAEAAAAGSYAKPTGTLLVTASVLFGQIYVLPIL